MLSIDNTSNFLERIFAMNNMNSQGETPFDQSIPQEIVQARNNASSDQPLAKGTVQAGNRMMIDNILNMPVQPYQDGTAALRVVETIGHSSKKLRQVPLGVVQYEGQRYLIAPSSGRDWVRNLVASDSCTLVTKESRESVHAALTLDDTAIRALRAYMAVLPDWTLRQFPFSVDASDEEIHAQQRAFAIFRLS
jgi:deazaflavin-dependent oxidoreductase (nitroreductase family)